MWKKFLKILKKLFFPDFSREANKLQPVSKPPGHNPFLDESGLMRPAMLNIIKSAKFIDELPPEKQKQIRQEHLKVLVKNF